MVNILLNSGADANIVANIITNRQENIPPINLKKITKKTKAYVEQEGTKCSRCGKIKKDNEIGINPVTTQLYSMCIDCRDKASEKISEKRKKDREITNKEYVEKTNRIKEQREKLLSSDVLVSCYRCKIEKDPIKFGINKRMNILYKICKKCRGITEEEILEPTGNKYDSSEKSECGKCHKEYEIEINPLNGLVFKTCKICREKDKKIRENANEPVHECSYCKKEMEPSFNPVNKKYYKNCYVCREKRKKYDKKKTEKHGDEINKRKKEYYQKNKKSIRDKQKQYYDKNSKKIIEHKKQKSIRKQNNIII